ncbi:MAG: ThuA domain-containing protein, partial [Umezawaea sp.]
MGPRTSPRGRRGRKALSTIIATVLVFGGSLTSASADPTAPSPAPAVTAAAASVSVLVFHGAAAEQQDPVGPAVQAIKEIGAGNGIAVEESSDPAAFTADNLARFRGVVFLSSQGATLSPDQEAVLQGYLKAGGGFLGVADAAKAQEQSTWVTGLIGTRPVGSEPVVESVTASGENAPNETKEKLTDGNPATKWLARTPTGWVAYRLKAAAAAKRYTLTSANDTQGRDPKDWTLQGSADGTTWTDLDRQTGQAFPERLQTRTFAIADPRPFQNYRLTITANSGVRELQLADLRLISGDPPPTPEVHQSVVNVLDRQHPANAGLPLNITRTDRWYNWEPNPVGIVHTVAQVEERRYQAGQGANGPFHPVSWCRDYEGGRSFYTGMGHTEDSYREDAFRGHLAGALKWTTGLVRGDCQATIAANYKIERLTAANKTGELDQIGEPHGLTITADGTVFYVGKAACP